MRLPLPPAPLVRALTTAGNINSANGIKSENYSKILRDDYNFHRKCFASDILSEIY
jgi:hypothetical protein